MKIENPKFNFELVKRFLHIPDKKPNRVQVEITNRCNLNCSMCPRDNYKLLNKDMPLFVFKRILPKLKNVDLILPIGWGESFIHPEFDKIINYLKKHNHEVKVTTNGLLLNNRKFIETALKIDYLTFSLDELKDNEVKGHKNKQVIKNIELLIREKNRRKMKKPYVALQPVLFKDNKDILDIIKIAKKLGVDRVNLVRPYTKFNKNLALSWKNRKKVYKKAEKLARKLNIRVDMFEYASFTGIKRFLWKHFKFLFRTNQWCPRIYDFAYVTIDGEVTPCCALPRYVVGDLKKQTIDDIWNGKKMRDFRKNHLKICKGCEVFKVK